MESMVFLHEDKTDSYISAIVEETIDQVNKEFTLSRAFIFIWYKIEGFDKRSLIFSADASGSLWGVKKPVSLSFTLYLIPPTLARRTGVPHAMDSTVVIPNGSYHGVVTNISAAE